MAERPSHPGFFPPQALPAELVDVLVTAGTTMIPPEDDLPGGGDLCRRFVDDFATPDQFDSLVEILPGLDASAMPEALATLERDQPAAFELLRWLVYHAYYGSPTVVDVLRSRGSDYHGAPQPHGYATPDGVVLPQHARGAYLQTNEVTDVRNR
jgi:hypothetical protein